MKKIFSLFCATIQFLSLSVWAQTTPVNPAGILSLQHTGTFSLPTNTHRPEILATDSGDIILVVVEPAGKFDEQIKHQMYRYDSHFNLVVGPIPLTRMTQKYGDPSDQRAIIINNELVVVYQASKWKSGRLNPALVGPAEMQAKSQSLILARFTLKGEKIFEEPIVSDATDFSEDSFPDHCLAWNGQNLLVSTGSFDNRKFKIREVSLDAKTSATHEFAVSSAGIADSVGNSLSLEDGKLRIFSASDPMNRASLTVSSLDSDFHVTSTLELHDETMERNFPVSNINYHGTTLVGFISRSRGGARDLRANPYHPSIGILKADNTVASIISIDGNGFAHVHPTMIAMGNKLFLAWSKAVAGPDGNTQPEVQIETYSILP